MKYDKSLIKVLGLGLSFPSTILALAYGCWLLVQKNIVSREISFIIFLTVIGNTLFGIVYYAIKARNKDKS